MRWNKLVCLTFLLLLFVFTHAETQNKTSNGTDFSQFKGPYLGETPPGEIPKIFASGVISTELGEGCSGWGNDMEYFIFQRWANRKAKLYIMNQVNGVWSEPELLPFVDKYQVGDFTVAPDGKTMVFASNIFIEDIGAEGEGGNIWMVEKTATGWKEPKHVGAPVNTKYHDSYPSLAANGNLYFFSRKPGGFGQSDLYMAKYSAGKYQKPINLGKRLNTGYHEWDTYIAPDESYLIYCSMKPGGLGEDDLYITFRGKDGSWGIPVHMGNDINTEKSENRPYVSPDGKYFFYASTIRGNRDIYWMDAKIIDDFRKSVQSHADPGTLDSMAIVTYVSNNIQERSTRAFIRSVRDLGGKYQDSKIYIVLADPVNFPGDSLKGTNVILLPLEMDPEFMKYPLAIKAFVAAQVEETVKDEAASLAWFDPATLVLNSLDELDLENGYGVAIRPVSLVNTIGIAPGSEPNDYWAPIYKELGLNFKNVPAYETVVDEKPIQPYFNCEIFSVDPSLGIFSEWAKVMTKFLRNEKYQKNVCNTFLRKLFLHQAILSGVIVSKVNPENIKPLSIKTGYPFGQHERLSAQKQVASLNTLSAIIFDYQWEENPKWLGKIPSHAPLKNWLIETYKDYLR